ncbi:hypothetical protein [Sphingomonas bacterium]|uniref:hypothetical protein n=1 Tax=Sphingomonas bacterium TaxID=1895847 RepID=UPI0020C606DF|nr:hypothetical protein [Sphingomonas bacterium]
MIADRVPDRFLVAVGGGGVEQPVADVDRVANAPLALGGASGSSLVANGITDTSQLGFLSPGLTVSGTNYFLRGVGNFTVTPYADPAVAFNQDSVYIGRPGATVGPLYDLERVEVPRGRRERCTASTPLAGRSMSFRPSRSSVTWAAMPSGPTATTIPISSRAA